MPNVIGDAWVGIHPDTSAFESALTAGTAGPIAALAKALGPGGIIVGAVAAGAVAAGGWALNLGGQFNDAIAKIAANAGIPLAAANAIGQAFLTTGGQAQFSAITIASAFAPVAGQLEQINGKALTAQQSLNFMNDAMALADASGVSLGTSTDTLSGILQAFQLPLSASGQAMDDLHNASIITNTPIDTLAAAIEKLHGKLGPIGGDIGQLSTLFVDLAEHGVSGSRALLAVSTATNTLLAPTKAGAAEIKTLGLHMFDASGNFVGFQSVIAQLQPKLVGMTEQQRMVAENTLLGKGAFDKFDATIKAGLPGWDKAAATATKVGTTVHDAGVKTDTVGGQFNKLTGAVTDFFTKEGTPINTGLKNFLEWLDTHLTPIAIGVGAAAGAFAAWSVVVTGIWVANKIKAIVSFVETAAGWLAMHAGMLLTSISFNAQYAVLWIAEKATAIASFVATGVAWLATQAGMLIDLVAGGVTRLAAWVAQGVAADATFTTMGASYAGTLVGMEVATAGAAVIMLASLATIAAPLAFITAGIIWALNNKPTAAQLAQSNATPGTTVLPGQGIRGVGHAMGGVISAGGWGTAGEGSAWELLHALPGGGVRIYPNRQSTAMAASGGSASTQHITINVSGANLTGANIAQELAWLAKSR